MKTVSLIALAACAFYASHASAQTMPFYPSPSTGQTALAQTTPGVIAYTDGSLYIDAVTANSAGCELRTRRRHAAWHSMGHTSMTYESLVRFDASYDADERAAGRTPMTCVQKPFPTEANRAKSAPVRQTY